MNIGDKLSMDLDRLLKNKDFKSDKELRSYLDSLIGKPLPEISIEDLSPKELAEELIFEAREVAPGEGRIKAEEALKQAAVESYERKSLCCSYIHKALPQIWFSTLLQSG